MGLEEKIIQVVVVFASFFFTYASLYSNTTKAPLNLLKPMGLDLNSPDKWYLNLINIVIHFLIVLIFVMAFSGMVLSDSGKSFYEIPGWKLVIFSATITAVIYRGESIKEALS